MKHCPIDTNPESDDQVYKWFVHMQSDTRTKNDIDEYIKWLKSDRKHYAEYRQLEAMWRLFGSFAGKSEILDLGERAKAEMNGT